MKIEVGKKMLFLESWPHGSLVPVTILGENTVSSRRNKAYYIQKPCGGTDTTTDDFLFIDPYQYIDSLESPLETVLKSIAAKEAK